MEIIPNHFKINARSIADPRAVVLAPQARFTVLTPCLIRIEYCPDDQFEDRPSQVFWHREQPVPVFEVKHLKGQTEIFTEYLHIKYSHANELTAQSLSIQIQKAGKTWHFGDVEYNNLRGTGRTLDEADDPIPLEEGLMNRLGWKVVDDTKGLIFDETGWLIPRNFPEDYRDLYFFGYGSDYQECLRDFYRVSGKTPLIPRWALGNWWSRYWEFTQEELGCLMKEFHDREVPLSVCIIDMDWHITDIGSWPGGWTGYTWNDKLFPDYKGFIRYLHDMGLRTALNLHPASGVLPHEAMYPQMAEAMGIDPETKEPVKFDIENPKFLIPYFDYLHHPYEADGIDFWWMDWQQGNPSTMGINLLWWINHVHFMDLGRDKKKRPFIFSRWGGLGNHRYPIGFSGDSVISWKSLAFQPYMTATAANVGYGWWSHDIGGHMNGIQEPELFIRWVQFGIFSPIMRLHSTKNPFLERRPWGYDAETFRITKNAMQLRHALIPYLYSMAWRNTSQGIPLIQPMYHLYPELEEAYSCPNEYAFGSELLAAPFITPHNPDTGMSRQVVWLPEGDWFHFFTGVYKPGDAWHAIYGKLDNIPLFAKAGAIVPLGPMTGWGGVENPDKLFVHVFPGASNRFELYEDDGVSQMYLEGSYAITPMILESFEQRQEFRILPAIGETTVIPVQRVYEIIFHAIVEPEDIIVQVNGVIVSFEKTFDVINNTLTLSNIAFSANDTLKVVLQKSSELLVCQDEQLDKTLEMMLHAFRLGNDTKDAILKRIPEILKNPDALAAFQVALTRSQMRAFLETITSAGAEKIDNIGEEPYLIFWNNRNRPDITYLFSEEWKPVWPPKFYEYESGALPKFHLVRSNPDDDRDLPQWMLRRGKSPAIWQIDYKNLLRVVFTRKSQDDLYPRPKEGLF